MHRLKADVVVAGGGLVGLSLAAGLVRELGPGFRVRLHEPALTAAAGRNRAYAVAAAGCRLFRALGVWDRLAPLAQPISEMIITDSRTDDPVRPRLLAFGGDVAPGEPFAHMLAEADMRAALIDAAAVGGVELSVDPVTSVTIGGALARADVAGGSVETALVVAVDGRRSVLRATAGIPFYTWPYRQSGIVVTVGHEREHGGRAVEHFTEQGPFAILPLRAPDGTGTRSSIVWTAPTEEAKRLLALPAEDFTELLTRRFGRQLGAPQVLDRPQAAPLVAGVARRFFGDRLALAGDAAHAVHPIAGQGLNLGLKDAAALIDAVADAVRLGLDHGAPDVLRRYDAARRLDTMQMLAATDGLNRLFANDIGPLRALRDLGLGLVERAPALKSFFIRQAAGTNSRRPRLMRGGSS